jgi:hypothetical protein
MAQGEERGGAAALVDVAIDAWVLGVRYKSARRSGATVK